MSTTNALHENDYKKRGYDDDIPLLYLYHRGARDELTYKRWENVQHLLPKAKAACARSGPDPAEHFRARTKMGSG